MKSFADEVAFLKSHVDTLVLETDSGAQIAVVPAFQARVMTSAARSDLAGNGWINEELIANKRPSPHITPYGGEDRFWLGPEGGQFSLFFENGSPFDFQHWQTPALIDTEAYDLVASSKSHCEFRKSAHLINYSGSELHFQIDRNISLLSQSQTETELGASLSDIEVVAYESDNSITNTGESAWQKETGLLSIWILGMFKPTPQSTVILPYHSQGEGPIVNDAYFGKVPADRLVVGPEHLYFRGDGLCRSKIGLSRHRAKPIMGSYDPSRELLTLVQFSLDPAATDYVNSMWEWQEQPYAGDVTNSYNDGPPEPGAKPLGPFFELESSSRALALQPGETGTHWHRTIHLHAPHDRLNEIARRTLGCDLDALLDSAFWQS